MNSTMPGGSAREPNHANGDAGALADELPMGELEPAFGVT